MDRVLKRQLSYAIVRVNVKARLRCKDHRPSVDGAKSHGEKYLSCLDFSCPADGFSPPPGPVRGKNIRKCHDQMAAKNSDKEKKRFNDGSR